MKSLTCFSSWSHGTCCAVILERLAENCRGRTTAIICTRTNAPKYILESHRFHFGSICDQNGRNFEPCPGAKSIHISLTERACKSQTLFNDVSANKRVTLRVRICSGADSRGSKEAATRPSRTTDRSQEGTAIGCTGLSRLTPRINAETIRCLPRGTSSSSLRAAMAAT